MARSCPLEPGGHTTGKSDTPLPRLSVVVISAKWSGLHEPLSHLRLAADRPGICRLNLGTCVVPDHLFQ